MAHYQALIDQCPDPQRRRDAERVLEDLRSLCRAVQAYEQRDPSPTLGGFLEHARGTARPRAVPRRGGPADHAIDNPPRQRHRGAGGDPGRLRGAALAVVAGARDPGAAQEERRLFYVACTRAKDRLYVTHAAMRGGRQTGGPSRFCKRGGAAMSATRANRRRPRRRGAARARGADRRRDPAAAPRAQADRALHRPARPDLHAGHDERRRSAARARATRAPRRDAASRRARRAPVDRPPKQATANDRRRSRPGGRWPRSTRPPGCARRRFTARSNSARANERPRNEGETR